MAARKIVMASTDREPGHAKGYGEGKDGRKGQKRTGTVLIAHDMIPTLHSLN